MRRPVTITRLKWTDASLGTIDLPSRPLRLTRSLTSGLTRNSCDPEGVFWGVGDRGPNLKPVTALETYGVEAMVPHLATDRAKMFPMPSIGPSLARFRLVGDRIELEVVVPLRAPSGEPLSGLPAPSGPEAETEPALALDGSLLDCRVDGADTEGIAALPDGRFWISEEYGPSLLLVGADGVVEKRLVPAGSAGFFAGSPFPVEGTLPQLSAARKLNRGFEALALSADGKELILAFQSPLAHPDRAAHEQSGIVRFWVLDASDGAFLREYAYPLGPPKSFLRDCAAGPVERGDVKISEIASLQGGGLLVLERVTLSTHVHRIRLDPEAALPSEWLDPRRRPTLEQMTRPEMEAAGLPLLEKALVLSTDDHPEVCGDLEGMILLDAQTLLLANDSDYGTEGADTQFWKVDFPESI